MPYEVAERIPLVTLLVDVAHAAAQTGLQLLAVVAEEVHNKSPAGGGEDGPGVVADGRGPPGLGDEGQAVAGLDGDAGEGEDDAREDVDDDLLVDGRDLARPQGPAAKDKVAAEKAGNKGVVGA